ncbi:MAG: LrgB family protein [Halothermotrichaceae bacterium]
MQLIENPTFGITLTLITYYLGIKLKSKKPLIIFHPFLVSSVLIILCLSLFKIDYETYNLGGKYITYLLQPTVVALAIPMYRKIDLLKKEKFLILITTLAGSIFGIILVFILGKITGTSHKLLISMIPKAVTTPVAVEISTEMGGVASLTVLMVILNGLLGGMFGIKLYELFNIDSPLARGLSMGISSHGIGTGRILEESKLEGAVSGLAIGLMGFFTALFAPLIINILL